MSESTITVIASDDQVIVDAGSAIALESVTLVTEGPQGPAGPQGNPGITVSSTAPVSPAVNDLWLEAPDA